MSYRVSSCSDSCGAARKMLDKCMMLLAVACFEVVSLPQVPYICICLYLYNTALTRKYGFVGTVFLVLVCSLLRGVMLITDLRLAHL